MFVRIVVLVTVAAFAVAIVARQSNGAGRERTYLVQPGDTLWGIAASRFAGDPREAVWKIEQRNHLSGAAIRPGQRLVLPAG